MKDEQFDYILEFLEKNNIEMTKGTDGSLNYS